MVVAYRVILCPVLNLSSEILNMVTVVSTVPHPSVIKEAVCRNCGSALNYVPRDVQSRTYKDYSGCSDTDYFIVCPTCDEKVFVKNY